MICKTEEPLCVSVCTNADPFCTSTIWLCFTVDRGERVTKFLFYISFARSCVGDVKESVLYYGVMYG
jgi:hypothetical protein